MSQEDKLEIEKKKLGERFEIERDQIDREIQRSELLSKMLGDLPNDIMSALAGIEDIVYIDESRIKQQIETNESFIVTCDSCRENFEIKNIRNNSNFKCSGCDLVWKLDRDKFFFYFDLEDKSNE